MTHHHCGCKMLPPDFEANVLAMHVPAEYTAQVLEFAGLAPRAKPIRVRQHFKPIDDAGHLRYAGKLPARNAQPLLTYHGRRIPAANYAMAVFGNDPFAADLPLKRSPDCHVPECFAPAHWYVAPSPAPVYAQSEAELLYEARYGTEPKFRYYKRYGNELMYPQCPLGHALSIRIGDPKRNAYCRECYAKWQAWTKHHQQWQRNPMQHSDALDFTLALWRQDPSPERLGPIAKIWEWLDQHRATHPGDNRSAEELYLHEYGAGPASTTEYADMSSPEQTMQEAVDAMFAELEDV